MRAARDFVLRLGDKLRSVQELEVDLYGSLAATGHGHNTLSAVLLGMEGWEPQDIPLEVLKTRPGLIDRSGELLVAGHIRVPFRQADIVLHPRRFLPRHSNAMRFALRNAYGGLIDQATYYSLGGGFIEREGDSPTQHADASVPHPFDTAEELLRICNAEGVSISDVMLRNERAVRPEEQVREGIRSIHDAMTACFEAGIRSDGILPGGLDVRRRAPAWRRRLGGGNPDGQPHRWQEWVNLVALAVNEENAAGGRVVTAPTNGAAGVVPAVLHHALHFGTPHFRRPDEGAESVAMRFLLAAAAIGSLYKKRASISGAEVGCQGEIGSACSMAAAGLAEILGGTPAQVENAAEIAMEHNLGLTCDPVGGLVQIPCIERNAIAASKAVNAARMALVGDGKHRVSLDAVIATMRETGRDMSTKYKETSEGGLAISVVEC